MTSGSERRKPQWHQYLFQMIVPSVILAVLTGGAASLSELKAEVREKNAVVVGRINQLDDTFRSYMEEHTKATNMLAVRNSIDHHRPNITPCNGCHKK